MGWKDFVPDSAEDWVEDRAEDAGDLIEWGGDKIAGAAEKVGLEEAGDWVREKGRSAANRLGAEVSELELGQTEDPNKLVYGSVSKIRAQVSHLNDFKSSFTLVGNGLKGLEGDGLKGSSADAFREAIAKEPPRWFKAAEAFGRAADAMGRFAETVEWAQSQAKEALEEYNKAKKVSQDARTAYDKSITDYKAAVDAKKDTLPPRPADDFTDPAGPLFKAAEDKLQTARTQRNEVADTTRTAVCAARDAAPPKPSYSEQFGDGMDYLELAETHLAGGVLKGTAGLANFVRAVTPFDPYNLTHPAEYRTNLNSTVAGLVVAVNDPMGTGKQMLDEFMKDPGEGIGKLIPELIGTKGFGATKKTASVAKHADDVKGPGRVQAETDGPHSTSRKPSDKECVDDPVDVATGRTVLPQTDLVLPASLPLVLTRTFESSYRAGRWFGPSWSCTLDQRLEIDAEGVVLVGEDTDLLTYPHPAPGVPVLPSHGRRWPLSCTPEGDYSVTDPQSGRTWNYSCDGLLLQLGDRNGNWIAYEYDAEGHPTGISHSGGYRVLITTTSSRITSFALADGTKILDFGYTDGHLSEVTNSCGKPLLFGYDDRGRIVSWTDTNGRHFDYTYDDQDRCVAQSGTNGHLNMQYSYETGVTRATNEMGYVRQYLFNERVQVVATTDETGVTSFTERDRFNRVLSYTDPLGQVTRFSYDDAGRVTSVVGSDGRTSTAEYNDLGLPVRIVEPNGSVVRQTYDACGNRTSVTGASGARTEFEYDVRGNLTKATDALGNITAIRYNGAGLPMELIDAVGAVTSWQRDAFGRPMAVTDPLGRTTRLAWTVEGRLRRRTAPDGSTESWTYDGEGNCLSHRDAAGATTTSEFGDFDLLTARTFPGGARYRFTHDSELRLTEVVNPEGMTWSYTYDPAGRLLAETDFDARTTAYEYDVAGRLTARTTAHGDRITYCYDSLGRIIREGMAGNTRTYEYDVFGKLARVADADSEVIRLRDRLGRLVAETTDGRTVKYEYDIIGRRTSRTTPSGEVTRWFHDAAGRTKQIHATGHSVAIGRDAAGQACSYTFSTGVGIDHAFDEHGRRSVQQVTRHTGDALQRRGYAYRADGILDSISDASTGTRSFTTDGASRVVAVDSPGWAERYAYDSIGNQTEATWPGSHPGADTGGRRIYEGTRLTRAGSVRYEHDIAGRVVLRQKKRLSHAPDNWTYSWDTESRLTSVVTPDGSTWRYRYDPLGRRTAKQRLSASGEVEEEVLFTWDGPVLCEQTETSPRLPSPVTTTWSHEGMRPLTQMERVARSDEQQEIDSRFFAIVTDLVGTPTELVDEQGRIAWKTRSTLWGKTTWNTDAAAYTPLRFPGQYFDPESGLHYNVNRTYDPETARYLSPDPLGLAPSPNPVTYVHNPLTWVDPLGLTPADECKYRVERVPQDELGTLYHYTNEKGYQGILESEEMWPSIKEHNPKDARFGDGQYLSPIEPGTKTLGQLSHAFVQVPWAGHKFTHYFEIDVSGLEVWRSVERPDVYVILNDEALNLSNRIVRHGKS